METLKEFCEEAAVEYKRMLGYCETRWLALMPALERFLQLYAPFEAYFLSMEKCPVIIKKIFENESAEIWVKFLHNQTTVFHNTIKFVEGQNNTIMDVSKNLNDLKAKLQERLNLEYLPIVIRNELSRLHENGQVDRAHCLLQVS